MSVKISVRLDDELYEYVNNLPGKNFSGRLVNLIRKSSNKNGVDPADYKKADLLGKNEEVN